MVGRVKDEQRAELRKEVAPIHSVEGRKVKSHRKFRPEGSAVKVGIKGEQERNTKGGEVQKKKKTKKKPVKLLTAGVWPRLSTCASLAISKPRLIRQALNSSAPRVPEWSWGVGGQCQARRRGGHRPCSNTYSGVSDGEEGG